MTKLFGILVGALAAGVILGVLFHLAYPYVEITPTLGLLFALVGLILSGLIRAAWLGFSGKRS